MTDMTEDELETCWYCEECGKAMRDTDEGYVRHQIAWCSEECADNNDAKR